MTRTSAARPAARTSTVRPTERTSTIRRLLVANRGEIARRIIRTCRELGIATVAVHSDADADAPFVAEADTAVRLPGDAAAQTYLRGDLIVAAALAAGADAVHPGYGFLSENAAFAQAVLDAGLVWVGPTPQAIEAMGSKVRAKELMAAAGVPVLSADPPVFPLLVKASAGGGGRGMRVVTSRERLAEELARAQAEALAAFGDGTVFVEPYLPTARHVEVQVLCDAHGTTWILGDRDCSIQRRHQKVVEEAPAPNLPDSVRAGLHAAARAAAEAVGYRGAGTVEFLVDLRGRRGESPSAPDARARSEHQRAGQPGANGAPRQERTAVDDEDRFFFLEMNTRLQVEHPVTECVTGLDLVALQLAIAEGRPLVGEPPAPTGHAIEVRLYAEDPSEGFAAQTGRIRTLEFPATVRVDSGVEAGTEISIHYDAMLAKVIAHATDRETAVRRLDDALRRGVVHGVTTNVGLLRAILSDEQFVAGRMHTALLDERLTAWTAADERPVAKAALAAAVGAAVGAAASAPVLARIPAAWRNAPSQPRVRTLLRGERQYAVAYTRVGPNLVSSFVEGVEVLEAVGDRVVLLDGEVRSTYRVTAHSRCVDVVGPDGAYSFDEERVFVDPALAVADGSLRSPMPALVTAVLVAPGDDIRRGDPVVVVEAMKMQHTIAAPADGVVTALTVSVGQQVTAGAPLAVIEEKQ